MAIAVHVALQHMIGIAKLTEDMMRSMGVEFRGANEMEVLIAGRAPIGVDGRQINNIVFERVEIDDLIAADTGGAILDTVARRQSMASLALGGFEGLLAPKVKRPA